MTPHATACDVSPPFDSKPDVSTMNVVSDVSELPDTLHQKLGLSPNLVKIVNREANSRQKLAAKLVKKEKDTYGRKGKKRRDPERMFLVRRLTYHMRPLKPGEDEDENWRKGCAVVIDTANLKDKN